MSEASVKRAGGVVSWRFGSVPSSVSPGVAVGLRRCDEVADLALRQDALLLFELRGRIVRPLDVGAAEAGELDRLAAGAEHRLLAVRRPWP